MAAQAVGLVCPGCHKSKWSVERTRKTRKAIMRIRKCTACGQEVITYEQFANARRGLSPDEILRILESVEDALE
jgi:hypothetical protein